MHDDELKLKSAQRAVGAILIGGLVLLACVVAAILLAVFHDPQWALALIFLLPGGYALGALLLYQLSAEDEAKAKIQRRRDQEVGRILWQAEYDRHRDEDGSHSTDCAYVWVVIDNRRPQGNQVAFVFKEAEKALPYKKAGYAVTKKELR